MTTTDARKRHTENTTPKETPVTRHPETTTEWLEDIALELHAITGLLNERLARPMTVHPQRRARPLRINAVPDCAPFVADDDPDEALVRALFDANEEFEARNPTPTLLDPFRNLARAAREHIEAERPPETDWEGLFGVEQRKREKAEAELETVQATLRNVEARRDALLHERDEWEAKFEQADYLLAEVERLREGITSALSLSRDMQRDMRSSVTLAFLQDALCDLLYPTEGES